MGIILDSGFCGRDVYLTQNLKGPVCNRAFWYVLVNLDGLFYLVSNGEDRVQRSHRVLNNQGDFAASNLRHLLLGDGDYVFAVQDDTS